MKDWYLTMRQPTEIEKAWFAGLLDGEGYIQIEKWSKVSYYRLVLRIAMLHLPTLLKCQQIWDTGKVKLVPKAPTKSKPFWRWHVKGQQAGLILESCYYYLVTKKAEAEIAIAFQHQIGNRKRNQYTGKYDHSLDADYKALIESIRQENKSVDKVQLTMI